jgi:hypothetical protein
VDHSYLTLFFAITLGLILLPWIGRTTSRRLNSTRDWTPFPPDSQAERPPAGSRFFPYDLRLITSQLEPGETLEGFGRGGFSPPRLLDWKHGPELLMAVTSRRILLFELNVWKVLRTCFIPHDALRFVRPPKPGLLGTGRTRIGLESGVEYQMEFRSPLFNDEAMEQERRLAAYLQRLAWRFVPVRELRSGEMRTTP